MENKNPQSVVYPPTSVAQPPTSGLGIALDQTTNPDSLSSFGPSALSQPSITPIEPPKRQNLLVRLAKRADFVLAILIVLGMAGVLFVTSDKNPKSANNSKSAASNFDTQQIPLDSFVSNAQGVSFGASTVTINGPLKLNSGLVITPSLQPSSSTAGQLYYDQTTNELAYFNGTEYVPLSGDLPTGTGISNVNGTLNNTGVLSLQGQTGAITLTAGDGITIDSTTITNNGVLSVGSATGAITLGSGLSINGGVLTNSGVISAVSGSSNITVANDGSGNITISSTAGSGTVTSSGGATGRIAKFSGAQAIGDSLLSESGSTVTVTGGLSVTSGAAVTGALSVSGALTLGTALSVANGGTGATSLTSNGVLVGQGTGAITSVTASGAGLCFQSTAGAPAFSACPGGGGGGVTSLEGLTGVLTIDNATGTGTTITIDDATTAAKGIASFNSTNFSVTSGAVNTAQNINTGASPTFVGLTLTGNADVAGTLTAGTGDAFQVSSAGAVTAVGVNAGAGLIQGTLGLNISGAAISLNNNSNFATNINTGTSTGTITLGGGTAPLVIDSTAFDVSSGGALSGISTISTSSTINSQTISSTANFTGTATIQGSNALTLGVTGSATGAALFKGATAASGTITLIGQANPTGSQTITLPDATGTVCLTTGNCAGSGTGVTTGGGTANRLAKFSAAQNIENSTISDDTTNVTTSIDLIVQGGDATIGTTAQQGSLVLHDGNGETATVRVGSALAASTVIAIPTAVSTSDTVCLLTLANCVGSGSSSTLQAAYAAGNTITTTSSRDIAFTLDNNSNLTVATAAATTGFTTFSLSDGSNATPAAQLVLVRNNDTTEALAAGLKVTSAAGGITTALDASGTNITNALAIGGNAITGTNFGVTSAGAVTAVGVNATTGLLQGALGLTISGAAVSLNHNSNFATNINTGTSTGTITLGGGAAPLVIDSTNFDVSSTAVTLASNVDLTLQGATAYISNPQTRTNGEAFGASTSLGGNSSTAVGASATTGSSSTVAVGSTASASGQFATAIGDGASAGFASTVLGRSATATGSQSVALGSGSTAGAFTGSITIGESATATTDHQLVIGGATANDSHVSQAYLGSGVTDASPTSITLQGTGGSGTNIAGASFTLAGGRGTGSAAGGSIILQASAAGASGTTLRSLSTIGTLNATSITLGDNTLNTSVTLDSGTSTIAIGAGAQARTINLGTGAAVVQTISIGGTGANVIALGNTQTAGSIALGAAMTTGTISIGGTGAQTGSITLGSGTGVQAIDLATGGTGAKAATLGSTASTSVTTIQGGTGTAGGDINIGDQTTAGKIIDIGSVTNAGTGTVNIATAAAVQTVNIGSTNGASALNLNAGSGNAVLNATAGTVTLQTTTSGAINIKPASVDGTNIVLGTSDTVGTLLVLDTKTGSGDPTGVAGGMYYNSNLAVFRCYADGYWRDCMANARTSYHYIAEMSSDDPDHEFHFDSEGDAGPSQTTNGETGHPGIIRMSSGTSTNFVFGGAANGSSNTIRLGNNDYWRFETMTRLVTNLSTDTQRFDYRLGFIDNVDAGTDGCYFRYSHDVNSGKWQGVCITGGSSSSTCDAVTTVAVDTWYRLTVVVNAAGTSVDFQINGTSQCQVTTNIPTGSTNVTSWGAALDKTIGSTARQVDLDYMDIHGQLGTVR